jgi:hypothetical protein
MPVKEQGRHERAFVVIGHRDRAGCPRWRRRYGRIRGGRIRQATPPSKVSVTSIVGATLGKFKYENLHKASRMAHLGYVSRSRHL